MSTFDAAKVRAVSIELRTNTVDIYFSVLPVYLECSSWVLNNLDASLPAPYDVQLEIEAFQALNLPLHPLRLTPWITAIKLVESGGTYNEQRTRALAIELREILSDFYFSLLPIWVACKSWTLHGLDPALPTPYEVKIQIDNYEALLLPALRLSAWADEIQAALPEDTLTYPAPPVFFDGSGIFDGGGSPA